MAIVAAVAFACSLIPRIDPTTVGMLLVLTVLGVATQWGTQAAVTASLAGGLLLDYYFLPPPGFHITQVQHLTPMLAFTITAIVSGRYSARLNRQAREAAERRAELERLYGMAEVMLLSKNYEGAIRDVVRHAPEIFQAGEAAFFDVRSDLIIASTVDTMAEIEDEMRQVAAGTESVVPSSRPGTSLIAVRLGQERIGTLALCCAPLSKFMLRYVGHALAVGLARTRALEEAARTQAARESEELRSAMLDALAHDLKTPLTSIKAAVTSLLALNTPGHSELLSIIDEETDRLDRLSSQAIEMERVGVGMLRPEIQALDIRPAILETLEEMGAILKNRTVRLDFAEALRPAQFDRRLIKEALRQLLDNARKYSSPDSPIEICCHARDDSIIVTVADSGPGIPADEHERIFQKFYRGARRTGSSGIGLGLPIARSILKAHGGDIWVTSEPGQGSMFHFSLPACGTEQAATAGGGTGGRAA